MGGSYEASKPAKPLILSQQKADIQVELRDTDLDTTQSEKVQKLEKVLQKHSSPLASQSAYLVGVSNRYGLDYRLIPAIAYTESTLCKNYPKSTHNCWGWGNARISFGSFEEAIETIAQKITSLSYYRSWVQDQTNIPKLAKVYNAADTKKWTNTVITFMNMVEK